MGTRFWNCVGRCSQAHSDDEYDADFSQERFAVGYIRQQCRSSSSLLQWCYSSRNFGANLTVSAGNGTGADNNNRMQVDALKKGNGKGKGKHQNQKGNRTNNTSNTSNTDINTCKSCGRTDIGRKTAGDQVEERTTIPPVTATPRKARTTRKAKVKANTWTSWKRISLPKHLQPCRVSFTNTE